MRVQPYLFFSRSGKVSVPMWASPLVSLAIVHLMVPNACFLGHLSGIAAGALLACTSVVWLPPALVWVLLGLSATAMLLSFLRPRQQQWHAVAAWDSESAHTRTPDIAHTGAAFPTASV